ncbi:MULTISPECIES: GNAT family N-acetyltransferase [unclassified Ochrobactrum]|uniref:GNAT family N-acetyltransferase n=1 Tax=unclassified Ochrobactrum TaxID=239106 RepID=UPI000DEEF808|nr:MULTISPECIES: GNAT family N-acetyltransferase [unclassified Ochrobactrum]MBQ0707067.1 GNAT family N-acetyltransferase [Ochrobactrum sp. AP1BH01-1]
MEITIGKPALTDLPTLAQIYLDVRRETIDRANPGIFRLEDFSEHSSGETILVARSGKGNIFGFISVWTADDFIHMLYVSSQWRGLGVGSALLRAIREWPVRPYRLKCLVKNPRAKEFYQRHGFTVVGYGKSPEGDYEEMTLPMKN